ncbi:MAG: glycosyl hydrolase [Planctomycetota bacterium]|nr:MAG: glycosyl hydrolase [Planctomycetota bacterium]
MLEPRAAIKPGDFLPALQSFWELSAAKIRAIEERHLGVEGALVFTAKGIYQNQSWTEWTEGFRYGSALLQFDAGSQQEFLEIGRHGVLGPMQVHLSSMGVHDHGFQIVSTFGNLWRLMNEGRIGEEKWERAFYEQALRVSGAVQARRWTQLNDKEGFIYSFNGRHSLFADTMRSLRSLALAYRLGQPLLEEGDQSISLLQRLILHARATSKFAVYFGEGRDAYDQAGRVAHESLFNVDSGRYRCPGTQQGWSPFSTWTRGQAWVLLGFAEQLEFLQVVSDEALESFGGREEVEDEFLRAALACAKHYVQQSPTDGIPYWDTMAPSLYQLGSWWDRPAEPNNSFEPVDSSAAAIAAQGLIRLGSFLRQHRQQENQWAEAGLTIFESLLGQEYLSSSPAHQGLLLHALYHRPAGWDFQNENAAVPMGESCMWGDYHFRELALLVQRLAQKQSPYRFFGPLEQPK